MQTFSLRLACPMALATWLGMMAAPSFAQTYNTNYGTLSLGSNTTGKYNSAFGHTSLAGNTIGDYNSAFGTDALADNIGGDGNSAFGAKAMITNQGGKDNTAIGTYALHDNLEGNRNTAVGADALQSNVSGFNNSCLGYGALFSSTGSYNTAVGDNALGGNTTGEDNTALGSYAGRWSANNLTNATSVGNLAYSTASNKVRIGNSSVTVVEGPVNWSSASDGRFKRQVEENVPGLAFIAQLRPVTYTYDIAALERHSGVDWESLSDLDPKAKARWQARNREFEQQRFTGFIAQEVEAAAQEQNFEFSGVVTPQSEVDHYGLRYAEFVVPLVKATQEQQALIEAQQQEIEVLKQQVAQLLAEQNQPSAAPDKAQSEISVYPNPSTGTVFFDLDQHVDPQTISVEVFTSAGQLVYSTTAKELDGTAGVDLSDLPNGVYIIRSLVEGVEFAHRIILK